MISIKDYVETIFDRTGTDSHGAQRVNHEIRRQFELAHINISSITVNQVQSIYDYIL